LLMLSRKRSRHGIVFASSSSCQRSYFKKHARQGADSNRMAAISLIAVTLRVERSIDQLTRSEHGCPRHAKLLLDIRQVVQVVAVVPIVERKSQALFHVALFHARGCIHRNRRLMPHAD